MNYYSDNFESVFRSLRRSTFRARFALRESDIAYIHSKGFPTIEQHAQDFIAQRLAPEYIPNDGKQTPMRGHPVFIAQHACACCCRGCLYKWYGIEKGKELRQDEQKKVVAIIMAWIEKQYLTKNTDY